MKPHTRQRKKKLFQQEMRSKQRGEEHADPYPNAKDYGKISINGPKQKQKKREGWGA